ncbi:MAG: protein HflC, partial [Pseudomonadota bacterium]
MKPNFGAVIAGAIAVLLMLSASMYVVDQRKNAIVFRLGEVVSIKKDPGL